MASTTYANASSNIQTTIYNLLNSNLSNVNVLDGTPKQLMKGTGFPYVIVRTPTLSDDNIVLNNRFAEVTAVMEIEIWSEKESVVRSFYDSIRSIFRDNLSTTEGIKIFNYVISSSTLATFQVSENKTVHKMTLLARFKFGG